MWMFFDVKVDLVLISLVVRRRELSRFFFGFWIFICGGCVG